MFHRFMLFQTEMSAMTLRVTFILEQQLRVQCGSFGSGIAAAALFEMP